MSVELISLEDLNYYRMMQSIDELDDYDAEENKISLKKWMFNEGQIQPVGDVKLFNKIKPGYYTLGVDANNNTSVFPEKINLDKIYRLPGDLVNKVIGEINSFWTKKDLFKQEGILYKRGILLTGPPGTGKTSIVNILAHDLIKKGGIIFHIKNPGELRMFTSFVNNVFRIIEPDRSIITIIEDIDGIYNNSPSMLLAFLDGETQIENNVVIATTNRLQELDDLILRPSRFDLVIKVLEPEEDARKVYLLNKGISEDAIKEWLKKTDDMTFADIKEVYIAFKLFDYSLDDAIAKVKNQKDLVSNITFVDTSKKRKAGFTSR